MRERPRMDVLKPSTDWCWPDGPPEVRLPGGSLGELVGALVAADSGALLVYRTWRYVLLWVDRPPGPEDEDAAREIRSYKLTFMLQNPVAREPGRQSTPPGPFVEAVALTRGDRGADSSRVDSTSARDAIWRLLDKSAEALDAIG